ncbi:MAG: bifunctional diaminohydroxyphosphoribosylaminopyrimidine deaminase/5-amino-6-(5-phosphoribosylamino)uracil reductase RibD [Bryobacteraceae bacterium]|nr:bifunctional diaminohydroxyphosphoribosylaminopyrimidine deaminase/5-amino-6-(5-phosphoribosylamino)uracil reductase RibD [Bryobacteraceae bacterium]MDW8376822.1 bifunctional diaminohydroxyphosphoribosylaminopyrimidine deaminase/5-amino-6-(5-phosphoribosylamino)uracil reductase RibD [Bryobacterales bacterium]
MKVDYLGQALELARQGEGQTSPNPMVGAVVVREGEVVGRGYHVWARRKHAEILALEEAGERARGATLYVSLEPCSHQGRTPPCTQAIIAAGVSKVVAPLADPNPLVCGRGFEQLRQAGVAVEIDERWAAQARKLNEAFFHFQKTRRPLVTLKSALTLDGKIAAPMDNDGWITSERARAHVQSLRHASDCILTGIGTVLSDDCLLTDRTGLPRSRPLMRLVVDSQLRIPLNSKMVASAAGDLTVVTTSAASPERRAALQDKGVGVIVFDGKDGRTDLAALVEWLGAQQYLSLMIEAGSMVNWAALEAGIVDRIFFYYAPKILGGTKSLPVAGGTGKRSRKEAIQLENLSVHLIPPDEFAVECYLRKD